jgi:D-serine dehydratase
MSNTITKNSNNKKDKNVKISDGTTRAIRLSQEFIVKEEKLLKHHGLVNSAELYRLLLTKEHRQLFNE